MIVSKELIARILASFLVIAQKDINRFHPKDVQMVRTKSWWTERFVLINESEGEALQALVNTMEWRKLNGINEIKLEELEEAAKLGLFEKDFNDKSGRHMYWARVRLYKPSDLTPMIRQLGLYHLEQIDSRTSHEMYACVGDMTGVGWANMDWDMIRFIIQLFTYHYPRGFKYLLILDLDWIWMGPAKLILSWLNDELRNRVIFIKYDQLDQYVHLNALPKNLRSDNQITSIIDLFG